MISQPIDQFLPCCCRCLPIKQQCKKNAEKPSCFFIAQSSYSPFSSNCWFWGEHMICGCHGNCGWDNCSSCSAATAAAATVAVATEATAAAATLAAVMVAAAMATIFAQLLPPLQCIAQSCRALQKEQWVFDMIWFFTMFLLTIFLQFTVIWKCDARLNAKPNQLSLFFKVPCWKEQHKGLV